MQIGDYNSLTVTELDPRGAWLEAPSGERVRLLHTGPSDRLVMGYSGSFFVGTDAQGNALATQEKPSIIRGQVKKLRVAAMDKNGYWLDWGLQNQLLMPRGECRQKLKVDDPVVVLLTLDNKTRRLIASARLHKFLDEHGHNYQAAEAVSILIASATPLGWKAVVDQKYLGLLYRNEVFQGLYTGEQLQGYIKAIREDGKIDLTLQAPPSAARNLLADRILAHLRENGGCSNLTDTSPPELISQQFQTSKRGYKKALSQLYKQKLISIQKTEIKLLED